MTVYMLTMNNFAVIGLIWLSVVGIYSYNTLSALNSIIFTNIPDPEENEHSEYFFGKCASQSKTLIVHDTLEYENISGQLIIRGHLDLTSERIPNCVYIKATSDQGDMISTNGPKRKKK